MKNIHSEKKLEPLLKKLVEKELKGWCIKLPALHISGLPDRICLMPQGTIFFAETKTTKQKTSPIQKWVHNKLKKLGFIVYIVDSLADIQLIKSKYKDIAQETAYK